VNFQQSPYDYDYQRILQAHLLGETFHSLVMAAMIRADSTARKQLAYAFPDVANDVRDRGHPEIPPGRPERGDQARPGARATPGADRPFDGDPYALADQVAEAMGGIHQAWAPAVIAILRLRHPGVWDDAVSSAYHQDRLKEEQDER